MAWAEHGRMRSSRASMHPPSLSRWTCTSRTTRCVCWLCAWSFPACCAPLMRSSMEPLGRHWAGTHCYSCSLLWLTAMQLRRTDQSADGCVRRLKVRLSCFLALALPVRIRSAPKTAQCLRLLPPPLFGRRALSSFSSGCLASGRRAWLCLLCMQSGQW